GIDVIMMFHLSRKVSIQNILSKIVPDAAHLRGQQIVFFERKLGIGFAGAKEVAQVPLLQIPVAGDEALADLQTRCEHHSYGRRQSRRRQNEVHVARIICSAAVPTEVDVDALAVDHEAKKQPAKK